MNPKNDMEIMRINIDKDLDILNPAEQDLNNYKRG